MEKLRYWVWLGSIPGLGPRKQKLLLDLAGDPQGIWQMDEKQLEMCSGLMKADIKKLLDKGLRKESEKKLERIKQLGINIITIEDKRYPQYLKTIYDPPAILYVKGKFENEKMIAIVGSRNATPYGLSMAETLSRELAQCGLTVISGMARGIDSWAHKGALKAGGETVAVLGCGLDIIYPYENRELMEKIRESGAVISEYGPGTPPIPRNFPARNRIISGMSLGVVVIEANDRSGSLITANCALEQGREVFAVPGNINSSNSIGTNKLIRDGAKIVTGLEDILEELRGTQNVMTPLSEIFASPSKEVILKGLEGNERLLAEMLDFEALHIDVLRQKSGMDMATINSLLVMLELKGFVEQLPGKMFRLRM